MEIEIYEVSVRDGLQNAIFNTTTQEKIYMVETLNNAGFKNMEIASFVNPKLVPQMADSVEVFKATKHLGDFGVLIPNQKGFDKAVEVGVKQYNIFFSASNEFNKRNLNKTLENIFSDLDDMLIDIDRKNVRAYISCAFGCPFEGRPKEHKLLDVIYKADYLAETVVLCDTIGVAHPTQMLQTLELTKRIDAKIALHLHKNTKIKRNIFDNINAAKTWGVNIFDSSIGGLGGCPFIPNSGSNLSTNELIEWANKNNYETGIELENLKEIDDFIKNKTIVKRAY